MITKGHERIELRPGVQIRVRLRGIDAPELQQEGGPEAKAALTRLLFRQRAEDAQSSVRTPPGMGGTAQMWVEDVDRYARLVVLLWTHDASDISGAMVRLGHAWVYDKYSVVPNTYYLTEQEARDAKLGLWSAAAAEPVAPWEWRRQRRIVKGLACDRCGEQLAEWYSDGALEQYCAECVHM
jgi:endonuclease YncB( thermonuclease family)